MNTRMPCEKGFWGFIWTTIETSLYRSSEATWAELDKVLELWAKQVKHGTPMTNDEH
jgi:hypothetical protein